MKIFWSWQSNTPGKTGRHFVRDVLQAVVDDPKQSLEVKEPSECAARAAIHLDHNRKGVGGSPDLARVILEKIEQSVVFVADVTPVRIIHEAPDDQSSKVMKKVISPNVAIELSYGLHHALTDRALLMVTNEHYGTRADLPFDLQSKAGPLTFNLPPNASKVAIGVPDTSGREEIVGPIMQTAIQFRRSLNDATDASVLQLLRSYFIHFYDLAAFSQASALTDDQVAAHSLPDS